MLIRLLLLGGLAAIGYLGFVRRSRLPVHFLAVFGALGVAALAVLFPGWTTVVAQWTGVGRGADLVGYLVDVSLLFLALHYYTKFVDVQRNVTRLVREVAILRAEVETDAERFPRRLAAGPASAQPVRQREVSPS